MNLKSLERNLPTLLTVGIALVVTFPVYWMFLTSILPSSVVLSRTPPLLPPLSEVTFEAYAAAFSTKPILRWLLNSTIVTLGSVILGVTAATFAGYALSRFATPAQMAMGYVMLINRTLQGTLLVIPLFLMFSELRLIDSPIALILGNTTFIVPFCTWMMKGFFDAIPRELEEAAMIDGCSRLSALRRVILPLTRPGLAAAGIYATILAWSDFLFARTLVFNPERWTMTVGTVSFVGENAVDWSGLMAAGFISLVPVLILFLLLEPFLVSGLASGSVKG